MLILFDDIVNKYKGDHFFFRPADDLEKTCNAPKNKDGVFTVYSLAGGRIDLVYIGCSAPGQKQDFLSIKGLKDQIIFGLFRKEAHAYSWPKLMEKEHIEALDVYWYVTEDKNNHDKPDKVMSELLTVCRSFAGDIPKWNKKQ